MAKGRKVTPLPVKERKGTVRKCREPQNAPVAEALKEVPDVPDYFVVGGLAMQMWYRVTRWLIAQDIIAKVDLHNVEAFCFAYETWRIAGEELRDGGPTIMNPQGSVIKNPAATVMKEASGELRAFGALLGLNPADRSRMITGGAKQKPDNEFSEF